MAHALESGVADNFIHIRLDHYGGGFRAVQRQRERTQAVGVWLHCSADCGSGRIRGGAFNWIESRSVACDRTCERQTGGCRIPQLAAIRHSRSNRVGPSVWIITFLVAARFPSPQTIERPLKNCRAIGKRRRRAEER